MTPSRLASSRTAAYKFAPLMALSERSISRKMVSVISVPTKRQACIGQFRNNVPEILESLKSAPARMQSSKRHSLNVVLVKSQPSRSAPLITLSSITSRSFLSLLFIISVISSAVYSLIILRLLNVCSHPYKRTSSTYEYQFAPAP